MSANDVHDKLNNYAIKNDESLSNVVAKMAEFGFMVKESQEKKTDSGMTDIDAHCSKLVIQMNSLIKQLAEKELDYDSGKFNLLRDKAVDRFNEIVGIIPEEL